MKCCNFLCPSHVKGILGDCTALRHVEACLQCRAFERIETAQRFIPDNLGVQWCAEKERSGQ